MTTQVPSKELSSDELLMPRRKEPTEPLSNCHWCGSNDVRLYVADGKEYAQCNDCTACGPDHINGRHWNKLNCICGAHPKTGEWLRINCPAHGNRWDREQLDKLSSAHEPRPVSGCWALVEEYLESHDRNNHERGVLKQFAGWVDTGRTAPPPLQVPAEHREGAEPLSRIIGDIDFCLTQIDPAAHPVGRALVRIGVALRNLNKRPTAPPGPAPKFKVGDAVLISRYIGIDMPWKDVQRTVLEIQPVAPRYVLNIPGGGRVIENEEALEPAPTKCAEGPK